MMQNATEPDPGLPGTPKKAVLSRRALLAALFLGLVCGMGTISVLAGARDGTRSGSRSNLAASNAAALEILRTNCFGCHNEEKHKGGLDFSTRERLMKGGESGEPISLTKPDSSLLLKVLAREADPHMPPNKQLEAGDIRALRAWVRQGAAWAEGAMSGDLVPLRPVLLTSLPPGYHPVLAMALSDDGKKLVAGRGNRVILYDVTTTNVVAREGGQAHEDAVQSVAFSPDGKTVASGAFRKLVLWGAGETLVKRTEVSAGFSDRLTALTFTSDGARLLAAEGTTGLRGRIRVLDVASGALLQTWDAHNDVIFDLSLSQDDRVLATASADKLVKIWDFTKRRETGRIEGHSAAVYGVSLNPEGTQMVSAGGDKQLRIWDVKTREKVIGLGDPKAGVVAARWVRMTNMIFAATEGGNVLSYVDYKPHSGEQSSSSGTERSIGKASEGLQCMAVSKDGEVVCAGGQDGCIQVWKRDGKLIAKLFELEAN